MKPFRTLPLLLAAPFLAAQSTEKVEVKFAPKKGETFWFVQTEKTKQDISLGGTELKSSNETSHVLSFTVADVDASGVVTLDAKIVRVHGWMSLPGFGDVEFDSAKPGKDAEDEDEGGMGLASPADMKRVATAMADTAFTVKVSPDGIVGEVKGIDEIVAATKKKAGPMRKQLGDITAKSVTSHVEAVVGKLPGKPAGLGDGWERKDSDTQGVAEATMKLTLARIDGEQIVLDVTGTITKATREAKDGSPVAPEVREQMKIENGKVAGSQTVSRKDGFVLRSESKSSLELTAPGGPMGEVEITQTSDRSVERATAEAAVPKAEKPKDEPKNEEPKKDGETPKTGGEKK